MSERSEIGKAVDVLLVLNECRRLSKALRIATTALALYAEERPPDDKPAREAILQVERALSGLHVAYMRGEDDPIVAGLKAEAARLGDDVEYRVEGGSIPPKASE